MSLRKSPQAIDYEDGITCIDTEQVRHGMAASYLIRGGDEYAFVECGTALSVPLMLKTLDSRGIRREQVRYVMPTHVHLDHAGGAGLLMRELPEAKLVVHPRGLRHMADPSQLIAGATAVYGAQNMQRLYGEILPVAESRIIAAEDGHRLMLGDRELRFMDAPGHARHHYVIWDARSGGLFTGDVFGLSYRELDGPQGPYLFPTSTPVQFEPDAWLETLERMMRYQPKFVFLTHYGRLGDVAKLADDLRRGLAKYIEIGQRYADTPQRHRVIKAALFDYSLHELARMDCPVSERAIRQVLEFDMELNAQGLEVWLQRNSKSQKAA